MAVGAAPVDVHITDGEAFATLLQRLGEIDDPRVRSALEEFRVTLDHLDNSEGRTGAGR